MSKPEKSAITQAAEKKAHLKKNITQLVEQTQDASSTFNIALSALKNNNPESAIKKFNQVLEIDDSLEMKQQVMPNIGQAYLQMGDYPKAIKKFRAALKLNQPSDIKAFIHANLGFIYSHYQFYGFAIAHYHQAVTENKLDVTSLLSLGMLYENKFRYPDAKETFEKVLKKDPQNPYAKESLERIAAATPVRPKDPIVRLVKMLPTLGMIVAMTYDVMYDGYFPMVIYVYPESPLKDQLNPGDKILNVYESGGEVIDEDDERDLIELLDAPPETNIHFLVGEEEYELQTLAPIQRQIELSERIQVYRNWLHTFDARLAWLWASNDEVREHIGPIWGQELASLVKELGPLKHTYVYDFAHALLIEHIQAFSITETDPSTQETAEIEINFAIHLGRYFGKTSFEQVQLFPDLIYEFSHLQFQHMANLLAARQSQNQLK